MSKHILYNNLINNISKSIKHSLNESTMFDDDIFNDDNDVLSELNVDKHMSGSEVLSVFLTYDNNGKLVKIIGSCYIKPNTREMLGFYALDLKIVYPLVVSGDPSMYGKYKKIIPIALVNGMYAKIRPVTCAETKQWLKKWKIKDDEDIKDLRYEFSTESSDYKLITELNN